MEKPVPPPLRMHIIPANTSATAMCKILYDNGGVGFMMETEGDTLTNTLLSDHGNYSDVMRKSFHNELFTRISVMLEILAKFYNFVGNTLV